MPKVEDIKVLSKQGKSPCTGVFITHGGLSWVIEQAGFQSQQRRYTDWGGKIQITRVFRDYVKTFTSTNGRLPGRKNFELEAKLGNLPCRPTIKRYTGKTLAQLMYDLGFTNNRPPVVS